MKSFKKISKKIIFTIVSLTFTFFVFVNTYEVVANQDVPIATSLSKVSIQQPINNIIDDLQEKINSKMLNNNSRLDDLNYLEIPSLKIRIQLEEARKINDLWYQRPSTVHYIGLNKDDYGNVVDYLFYTNKSWRTIEVPDDIEVGTEIAVYSQKGIKASFRVADKQILPLDKSFIVNKYEDRQILLVVEDPADSKYYGYSLSINR